MSEYVVTIDADGFDSGAVEKNAAHREGLPHRAVSVMLGNRHGQVLLQRRSVLKYHCGGLWSNTCCGHPRPGESPQAAAERRLREELGIVCALYPAGVFRYRCPVTDGLEENELVHLYIGRFEGDANPAPAEVDDTRWVDRDTLNSYRRGIGGALTPWFSLYAERLPHFVAGVFVAPLTEGMRRL